MTQTQSLSRAAKYCKGCLRVRPASEWYRSSKGGLSSRCKECTRRTVTAHRARNVERIRAYDRERGKRPDRIAKFTAWNRAHRADQPRAWAAQKAVGLAMRSGDLRKGPCEVCGAAKVHGHHDDYAEPLNVRWLCPVHHTEWHQKNGPGRNAT